MLNQDFMLRKMTVQDVDSVMEIEKKSFTLPWSKESYLGELRNGFATYFVCDCESEVVGYGGIWVVFEDAHITNVAVSPPFRSRGIGRALMNELEKVARFNHVQRIILEVRPSNQAARTLYENLGYVATGLRTEYYSDNGEDAIIMSKMLF